MEYRKIVEETDHAPLPVLYNIYRQHILKDRPWKGSLLSRPLDAAGWTRRTAVKLVLAYGDSNTWGYATLARPDGRYRPDERWPGVLRKSLGDEWLVVEEGLPGRTTVNDDPVEGLERNGRTYLLPCLLTHRPIDVFVIMLGTVDLKARFNKTAWEIAAGVGALVTIVKSAAVGPNADTPQIIIICPPPTLSDLKEFSDLFAGGHEKSRQLSRHYQAMAAQLGAHFLDAGKLVKSSVTDGFHLDPTEHASLGRAVAGEIRRISPGA
ncbi:MAG: SGNH/GDSL hydrolase family protein [Roseiarcus sp.]